MGGPKSPLHDAGNHCPVEPYSPCRAARRGDLTNPVSPATAVGEHDVFLSVVVAGAA